MRKIFSILGFGLVIYMIALNIFSDRIHEPSWRISIREKLKKDKAPAADHSRFSQLQQPFTSPQQVTEACLSCHNQTHLEVMHSNHWNWEREEYIEGRGIVYIGKKNILNNFCIGVRGNEESCAKCHIGYGSTNDNLNIEEARNIDCLVCHDNTDTYTKANEQGGNPQNTLDLNLIAQHIGRPGRANCGVCHFYGGGGNNVKHGDLEMAMFEPSKETDIHMGTDGLNLVCVDCHLTEKHTISGKMYSLSSMNRNRVTCEQCHSETPHVDEILNEHTLKVSCQACHIPEYAKVNSTKTHWDWSTAGRLKDGKPFHEEDSLGNHAYMSIKGSFKWGRNLEPEYVWFNGTASHYLSGDVIADTSQPVILNTLNGSYQDQESKIIPVKIHRAVQPFDPVNQILIQPKLYAEAVGDSAFWKDFDWQTASRAGMHDMQLPYSGEISFIKTEMYWPVNHMVSAAGNTVACADCHQRDNSRMAGLNDFYMPGRDYSEPIELGGKLLLISTLLGVIGHGSLRIIMTMNRKKRGEK